MSVSRRILITGASRGIGLALAEHYVEQGDRVIGCARGPSEFVHERYRHVSADVTDERAVRALVKEVHTTVGGLDVLINNAGTGHMNPIALTPVANARRVMEVNFLGTFLLTRAAIRLLRSSGSGRIVNVTSVAVPLHLEGEAVYAASKSAIEMLTRITAREIGPFGITCNAVGPSVIRTRLTQNVPEQKLQSLISRQAIAQEAGTEDVANVVDFFLRPESRLITGQVIYLGGFG